MLWRELLLLFELDFVLRLELLLGVCMNGGTDKILPPSEIIIGLALSFKRSNTFEVVSLIVGMSFSSTVRL